MDTIDNVMPWIFAGVTLFGVGYLLIGLLLGGLGGDLDLDLDLDVDLDVDASPDFGTEGAEGEAIGISLNVIAAFCAGFGAIGLTGSLLQWPLLLTVLVSLLTGVLFSQAVMRFLRFVMRQQSNNILTKDRLIGLTARMTINTPAGKVGEALVEEYERIKYPVKHIRGEALRRNDIVRIVDVQGGRLLVDN